MLGILFCFWLVIVGFVEFYEIIFDVGFWGFFVCEICGWIGGEWVMGGWGCFVLKVWMFGSWVLMWNVWWWLLRGFWLWILLVFGGDWIFWWMILFFGKGIFVMLFYCCGFGWSVLSVKFLKLVMFVVLYFCLVRSRVKFCFLGVMIFSWYVVVIDVFWNLFLCERRFFDWE